MFLTPKYFFVYIFFAFVTHLTRAQSNFLDKNYFGQVIPQMDAITAEDGLPYRQIPSIQQDAKGLIWIGTGSGLLKYDGYKFTNYKTFFGENHLLNRSWIRQIIPHPDSSIWVHVADHYLRLDAEKNILSEIKFEGFLMDKLFPGPNDTFWSTGFRNNKAYLFHHLNADQYKIIDSIETKANRLKILIHFDQSQNIWWGIPNIGIRQYDKDGALLKHWKLSNGIDENTKEYAHYFFINSQGQVFVFLKNKKVLQLNPTKNEFDTLPIQTPKIITHAFEDHQQRLWLTAFRKPYLFKWEDESMVDYTPFLRKRTDYDLIRDIMEDRQGIIWVATDYDIIKLSNQHKEFSNYLSTPESSRQISVRDFFEDESGDVYTNCSKFNTFIQIPKNGEKAIAFPLYEKNTNSRANLYWSKFFVEDQEQNHWTVTSQGVAKIDVSSNSLILDKSVLPYISEDSEFRPLTITPSNQLIMGIDLHSLISYNPKNGNIEPLEIFDANLKRSEIKFLMTAKDGTVWACTPYLGVWHFDPDKKEILHHYSVYTTPSLAHQHTLVIHEDQDGIIWVGSRGGGLHKINLSTNEIKIYNTSDGLCNDFITGILQERKRLWITTYYGLSCFDMESEIFINYFDKDGLSHNEFNYSSFYKSKNGRLFLGGINGVNAFYPDSLNQFQKIPSPILTSWSKYDNSNEKLIIDNKNLTQLEEIRIEPSDTYFQFDFALLDYYNPQKNVFKTWLEGYENSWTQQGSVPFIRYGQLPAGKYVLHIKAGNSKGFWSEESLSIKIIVEQVFYKTWWFLLLCFGAAVGIIYTILRYRFLQKMKIEQMRSQISSDLHDEVGSSLTRLSMIMNSVEVKEDDFSKKYFQKGNEVLISAISKIRDVVWAIDAKNDQGGNLIDRMEDFIFDMLKPKEIEYQIRVKDFNRKEILPPLIRQNIYLIFKEAITNIVKHSNATSVGIDFYKKEKTLYLQIKDNGQLTNGKKVTGSGLSNMKLRAKRINGKVEIQNGNQGFLVELEVPLT